MKIIIPVKGKNIIASGFNSTPEVCIYDFEKNPQDGIEFKMWRDIIPQGSKITLKLKQENIRAVLTAQMQVLALNLFKENGIEVFKSEGDDLFHNLNLLKNGSLGLYTIESALENSEMCGSDCNSCSTEEKCK